MEERAQKSMKELAQLVATLRPTQRAYLLGYVRGMTAATTVCPRKEEGEK